MDNYSFFLTSSLEKVFPSIKPKALANSSSLSVWKGQRCCVQLVYFAKDVKGYMPFQQFTYEIKGSPVKPFVRKVELVPSEFPVYGERDDNYLTDKPGLFPDLLSPLEKGEENILLPIPSIYKSLWITFDIPDNKDIEEKDYDIEINIKPVLKRTLPNGVLFEDEKVKDIDVTLSFTLKVGKKLNEQKLIHTEWFHSDCLASFYNCTPFSDKHWEIIENFIKSERRNKVNMLLTPVFTPPLDTKVGGERITVQLVDVFKDNDSYIFSYKNLRKWCRICKRNKIKYLEIAHFFTQWGATSCPKIMATIDGKYQKLFGWETDSLSPEYEDFLLSLIPSLKNVLKEEGYDEDHVYYHISDEPSPSQLDSYKKARDEVKDLIKENQIIDALSSVEFYKKGIVPRPIPGSSEIDDFYKENIKGLWVYYCCAQCVDVPNRFFSMPSSRNRIMGVLMYLYNIEGFLHWGFNFYNSKFSLKTINPYINTHADFGYPSGDAFLVYPAKNGEALDSIRGEVQSEGITDLTSLQTLESLTSREYVEKIIYEDAPFSPFSFSHYPKEDEYLLNLRERVANEIKKNIKE